MKFKAHPLMIFDTVKPFLWILIIPFIKAVVQYLKYGSIDDIIGFETAVLIGIVLLAVVKFLSFRIIFEEDKIIIKKGLFFVTRSQISRKKLSSVQTEQNPLDFIFGAVTYRINTEAGARSRSDFKFKLSRKNSERLSSLLYGGEKLEKIHFSFLRVAIMAITTSSAVTGLFVAVPVLNNAARLLGIGIYELLDEINSVSNGMKTYFPPIVNTVTLILIVGYVISFIYSFIKYINFRLYLNDKLLKVCTGFFVRRITVFKKRAVNDVKIEQTPLMLLFRRFAMKVSVGGFAVSKNALQVIVPSGTRKEIREQIADYFPFLKPDGIKLMAERCETTRNRFLFWPLLFLLITLAISITSVILFEEFTRFIFFLTVIALCLVFCFAYTCQYEYKKGKIMLGDNIYAHSNKGFRTCRLYCPKEKVGQIKITRIGIDHKYNTCRVRIIVCSESADSIRVRHLDYGKVVEQINKIFETDV